jgi:ubiquinone/menaquinone biosynthesis C-methylase UbiE
MIRIEKYFFFTESRNIGSPLLDIKDNVDNLLISKIKKEIKIGDKLLEISCGNGSDSYYLMSLGYDVICTEINDKYIGNAISIGLNCIKHNTIDKFPFNDNEFEIIYSRLELHYFTEEELYRIFKELKRIGKKILITVKIVDDIKTGKIILTENKWYEIISGFFEIKEFDLYKT